MERNCGVPEITIPEELPDFNAQGSMGSWRQLLAANIGRYVKIEVAPTLDGSLRMSCGTIYAVGSFYVVLVSGGKATVVDTMSIKYAYFE